jgi:ADP-ribose pyrophosphatase
MPDEPVPFETLLETRLFRVIRQIRQTPRGPVVRDTIQHPGAVTIVPLLEGDRVVLIRNYRVAVQRELIELPAGTLEPGEPPDATAARELLEETGYAAGRIEQVAQLFMSPGILHERMYVFVAWELTLGEMNLDAGEEIEPLILPWNTALQMVADGRIQDAKSVAGLLWCERFWPKA